LRHRVMKKFFLCTFKKKQRLFVATGVLQKFTKVHRNSPVPEKVHLL